MALGARQNTVLAMILRESLILVCAGMAAGIPIAIAAVRSTSNVLSDLLFGVNPVDPLSFAAAIFTMTAVALLAVYFPARRAARTDPKAALRCD